MKLYELDNEYLDFIAAVEDGTIPEDAIEDTLEMLNGDYKDKLDNTICAIKNLTAEAKMIDEEIKSLSEGVIDAGYTGSICVKLYNNTRIPYTVERGDKISQLVILPIYSNELEVVDSLETTARGNNGFGSSGR